MSGRFFTGAEHERSRLATLGGAVVLVVALASVGIITLAPSTDSARLPFWCLRCGARPGIDVLLNILLFVPLGVALGLLHLRAGWAALAIIAVTVSIESLQFALPIGRFPSARDIITNTAGGLAGWQVAREWRSLLWPPPRRALALGAAAASAWIAVQAFTAWAVLLVAPPPPWWAQIRLHDLGFSERFGGEVTHISLGSIPILYSDQLEESGAVRRQLVGGAPLRVSVTDAGPIDGHAPILMLATDDRLSEIISLVQDGDDAFFRIRMRASALGLRSPGVRLEGVFSERWADDTIRITAVFAEGRYRVASERNGDSLERELAASPSWTWALLMPVPHYAFGGDVRFLTAAWLFAVFALIGYWVGLDSLARHTRAGALAPVIVVIVAATTFGLAAAPVFFGLPVSHWSEWAASAIGAVCGWLVTGRITRLKRPPAPGR